MIQLVFVIQQQRCRFKISKLQSTSAPLRKKLQNARMVSFMFKIARPVTLFVNVMNHSIRLMANVFQHVVLHMKQVAPVWVTSPLLIEAVFLAMI